MSDESHSQNGNPSARTRASENSLSVGYASGNQSTMSSIPANTNPQTQLQLPQVRLSEASSSEKGEEDKLSSEEDEKNEGGLRERVKKMLKQQEQEQEKVELQVFHPKDRSKKSKHKKSASKKEKKSAKKSQKKIAEIEPVKKKEVPMEKPSIMKTRHSEKVSKKQKHKTIEKQAQKSVQKNPKINTTQENLSENTVNDKKTTDNEKKNTDKEKIPDKQRKTIDKKKKNLDKDKERKHVEKEKKQNQKHTQLIKNGEKSKETQLTLNGKIADMSKQMPFMTVPLKQQKIPEIQYQIEPGQKLIPQYIKPKTTPDQKSEQHLDAKIKKLSLVSRVIVESIIILTVQKIIELKPKKMRTKIKQVYEQDELDDQVFCRKKKHKKEKLPKFRKTIIDSDSEEDFQHIIVSKKIKMSDKHSNNGIEEDTEAQLQQTYAQDKTHGTVIEGEMSGQN